MGFKTLVVAAVILVLASAGGLAAYQIADHARGEAAQTTVEREDSLAVEPDIRQKLVSDDDHDPTAYGENGTETVEYDGTVWEPSGNYTYYADTGEIEFLRDEPDEANISYQYDVPADQAGDEQLQLVTVAFNNVGLLATGFAFVVLFLFLGGFVARRMGGAQTQFRGR